jgi:hypothetical protein
MAQVLMRQYDVFANPSSRMRTLFPYVLVLQLDLVSETEAVIGAPLSQSVRSDGSPLYPELAIANGSYTTGVC